MTQTGTPNTLNYASPAARLPATRWLIVSLLFLAAVLNYVDKNTLSLLAPTIQKDLGFDDHTYGYIQNAFQVAYTIALLASGIIVDKLGPRISLALFVGWWSCANVLTAFVRSVTGLGACRSLLGLGEAGNWTASPKAVSEWFPAKERGLAIGIYTAGTPIGMTLAPLLIVWMSEAHGWRSTFVVTGLAGMLWVLPWLLFYRPIKAAMVRMYESHRLTMAADASSPPPLVETWTWCGAFTQPAVWCLLLGRMLSDPVWFFYQNWFPKYLVSAWKWTQADVKLTWIMFMAAGIGSLLGGIIAGQLIKGGRSAERARLWTMLGSAIIMPLSPMVALAPSANWSLALASIIALAHLAWLTNISALVVDVVPAASLGKVFGIVAAGSSLGGILMNDFVGRIAATSYDRWFWIAAVLHPIAWIILWAGIWNYRRPMQRGFDVLPPSAGRKG